MVQVLHGRAATTAAVRRAIQHSQESLRVLAVRYGINQKTVAKWKKRSSVVDLPTSPVQRRNFQRHSFKTAKRPETQINDSTLDLDRGARDQLSLPTRLLPMPYYLRALFA